MKSKLTQDELKTQLDYDPSTGIFTRKTAHAQMKIGDIAGVKTVKGYITISVLGVVYFAHRLAFLYMDGKFPEHHVDHINHVRDDNRFCNLRATTKRGNEQNRRLGKNNSSGFNGVSWNNASQKWIACIGLNGTPTRLKTDGTLLDAVAARLGANRKYNYHENHGKADHE